MHVRACVECVTGGVLVVSQPGFYCSSGYRYACGGHQYYCPGGTSQRYAVSSGYYSTGGTWDTRDSQYPCEVGGNLLLYSASRT